MAVFTVIDHVELTGTTSAWEKTSIPDTYDHLYLETSTRSDATAEGWDVYLSVVYLEVNGHDTQAEYSNTNIYWYNDSTPLSDRGGDNGFFNRIKTAGSDGPLASTFSPMTIWIPNYANTTGYKQMVVKQAIENNSTSNYRYYMALNAELWSNTDAINALKLYPSVSDFVQYSTFTLYGVKGA
jgi:hypothetical protein